MAYTLVGALLLSIAAVALLRFVDPWSSAVIVNERASSWFDDKPGSLAVQRQWRDFNQISPQLALAVIAAEDQQFPDHNGFDFKQIQKAMDEAERGGRSRGASTITQQVAKNLFLWSGRSYLRKGLEAWFTLLMEVLWPKQRILEVYLNVAEFGRGIYGAEAAAQAYFHKPARNLSRAEAARLAAVLPSPRRYRADNPGPYVQQRQLQIEAQMAALGGASYLARLK
ncbi:MAG: monofunctional biosynthetic peptidoglycan transglycosylase [Pseudomonadota bacterium]